MPQPRLFQSASFRGVTLPNRIVISPMCQYSAIDGMAGDWHLVHLGKFAQGGAGSVMVEATAVTAEGRITHGDVGLWHDGQIAPLKRIAAFIKENGSVPAIQLAHAGRKASCEKPWRGGKSMAPGSGGWTVATGIHAAGSRVRSAARGIRSRPRPRAASPAASCHATL
jgi:2,4-dienoyl-CoA reductase-like NADH-dependent reductase (Old Yellow Enzyme family)